MVFYVLLGFLKLQINKNIKKKKFQIFWLFCSFILHYYDRNIYDRSIGGCYVLIGKLIWKWFTRCTSATPEVRILFIIMCPTDSDGHAWSSLLGRCIAHHFCAVWGEGAMLATLAVDIGRAPHSQRALRWEITKNIKKIKFQIFWLFCRKVDLKIVYVHSQLQFGSWYENGLLGAHQLRRGTDSIYHHVTDRPTVTDMLDPRYSDAALRTIFAVWGEGSAVCWIYQPANGPPTRTTSG